MVEGKVTLVGADIRNKVSKAESLIKAPGRLRTSGAEHVTEGTESIITGSSGLISSSGLLLEIADRRMSRWSNQSIQSRDVSIQFY